MSELIIKRPQISRSGDAITVSSDFLVDGEILLHRAYFRFLWDGEFRLPGGEPFVSLALAPAMKLGLPIRSEAPLAPGFLDRIRTRQDILGIWLGDEIEKVPVFADETRPLETGPRGTAAFFSGGVDAFHAVQANRDAINALIFIEGFDIPLFKTAHRALVRRDMRAAAAAFGLPLIVVETDSLSLTDRFLPRKKTDGSATSAIIQLFGGYFSRVILGASQTWSDPYIGADAFVLEREFSLPDLEVSIDGMSKNRSQKLTALADCPAALRHLRVCWRTPEKMLNCGQCEKCLRTMVAALGAGLLGRIETLPPRIDPHALQEILLCTETEQWTWRGLLDHLGEQDAAGIERAVSRGAAEVFAQRLWESGICIRSSPNWPVLARKLGKPTLAAAWQDDRHWILKKCAQNIAAFRGDLFRSARSALPWRKIFTRPHGKEAA